MLFMAHSSTYVFRAVTTIGQTHAVRDLFVDATCIRELRLPSRVLSEKGGENGEVVRWTSTARAYMVTVCIINGVSGYMV